jgi:hypothetical protein
MCNLPLKSSNGCIRIGLDLEGSLKPFAVFIAVMTCFVVKTIILFKKLHIGSFSKTTSAEHCICVKFCCKMDKPAKELMTDEHGIQ